MIAGLSFVQILKRVVIIAACIALMYVALTQFGIVIPAFVIQCLWIVAVAVIVLLAIKIVAEMW